MNATAEWVVLGLVVVLAGIGALRFDVLLALLRDKLTHPEVDAANPAVAALERAEHQSAEETQRHQQRAVPQRKPEYHHSGRRG